MSYGSDISALRTGAYAAIVADYLMPKQQGNIIACIGAGKIAEMALLCINATLADRVKEIKVYSKTPDNTARLVKILQEKIHIDISVVSSVQEAVKNADYVITATTALEPLIHNADLQKNVTVLLLGGDEVAEDFIDRAYKNGLIFCDKWLSVKDRNVQSLPYFYYKSVEKQHSIDERKFLNLSSLINNELDIEHIKPECIFVNCVGLGDIDLEITCRLYEQALEKNVGTYINL